MTNAGGRARNTRLLPDLHAVAGRALTVTHCGVTVTIEPIVSTPLGLDLLPTFPVHHVSDQPFWRPIPMDLVARQRILRARIEESFVDWQDKADRELFLSIRSGAGEPVGLGWLQFYEEYDHLREVEISALVALPYQRHGYGIAAAVAGVEWVFGLPGVERVVAGVYRNGDQPGASEPILRKLGFTDMRRDAPVVGVDGYSLRIEEGSAPWVHVSDRSMRYYKNNKPPVIARFAANYELSESTWQEQRTRDRVTVTPTSPHATARPDMQIADADITHLRQLAATPQGRTFLRIPLDLDDDSPEHEGYLLGILHATWVRRLVVTIDGHVVALLEQRNSVQVPDDASVHTAVLLLEPTDLADIIESGSRYNKRIATDAIVNVIKPYNRSAPVHTELYRSNIADGDLERIVGLLTSDQLVRLLRTTAATPVECCDETTVDQRLVGMVRALRAQGMTLRALRNPAPQTRMFRPWGIGDDAVIALHCIHPQKIEGHEFSNDRRNTESSVFIAPDCPIDRERLASDLLLLSHHDIAARVIDRSAANGLAVD